MADMTITGCVNWTTGKPEFDMDDECTYSGPTFYGCIEWTGANAGKVKVVITGKATACNGTYYGCVDWTTGKFEIDLPEECCSGEPCTSCGTADTPLFIQLSFSGYTKCYSCFSGYSFTVLGDLPTIVIEQSSACQWNSVFDWTYAGTSWGNSDCTGSQTPIGATITDMPIEVSRTSTKWVVFVGGGGVELFDGDIAASANDCQDIITVDDGNTACSPPLGFIPIHSGTATITPL